MAAHRDLSYWTIALSINFISLAEKKLGAQSLVGCIDASQAFYVTIGSRSLQGLAIRPMRSRRSERAPAYSRMTHGSRVVCAAVHRDVCTDERE